MTTDHTDVCKESSQGDVQALRDAWCFRCLESCVHAKGRGAFDERTSTWYQRLFANRPTMDPSDPRFASIANKRFLPIAAESGWGKPDETERPLIVQVPAQVGSLNTPSPQGGIIIGGGLTPPAVQTNPTPTSWDAPPKKPGNVVKVGAKVKMGGDPK